MKFHFNSTTKDVMRIKGKLSKKEAARYAREKAKSWRILFCGISVSLILSSFAFVLKMFFQV